MWRILVPYHREKQDKDRQDQGWGGGGSEVVHDVAERVSDGLVVVRTVFATTIVSAATPSN